MREYLGVRGRKEVTEDELNAPFTLQEMKRAIDKSGMTSPGKEQMLYHVETSRRYWVRQDSESV